MFYYEDHLIISLRLGVRVILRLVEETIILFSIIMGLVVRLIVIVSAVSRYQRKNGTRTSREFASFLSCKYLSISINFYTTVNALPNTLFTSRELNCKIISSLGKLTVQSKAVDSPVAGSHCSAAPQTPEEKWWRFANPNPIIVVSWLEGVRIFPSRKF